jgi:hypothetical protein
VKAARPANVLALVVALVWVWAFAMPAAQEHLPPEVKDYLNGPSDTCQHRLNCGHVMG